METLLYVLGFIIGALGTWFLLYFLKTRKLLRTQHKLIINFTMILCSMSKEIADLKNGKKSDESAEKKPCDNEVSNDAEPARQEPGNCAGDCDAAE